MLDLIWLNFGLTRHPEKKREQKQLLFVRIRLLFLQSLNHACNSEKWMKWNNGWEGLTCPLPWQVLYKLVSGELFWHTFLTYFSVKNSIRHGPMGICTKPHVFGIKISLLSAYINEWQNLTICVLMSVINRRKNKNLNFCFCVL